MSDLGNIANNELADRQQVLAILRGFSFGDPQPTLDQLHSFGEDRVFTIFSELLGDPAQLHGRIAEIAILLNPSRGADLILPFLVHPDPSVRASFHMALKAPSVTELRASGVTARIVNLFLPYLTAEDSIMCAFAITLLGRYGDEQLFAYLNRFSTMHMTTCGVRPLRHCSGLTQTVQ